MQQDNMAPNYNYRIYIITCDGTGSIQVIFLSRRKFYRLAYIINFGYQVLVDVWPNTLRLNY